MADETYSEKIDTVQEGASTAVPVPASDSVPTADVTTTTPEPSQPAVPPLAVNDPMAPLPPGHPALPPPVGTAPGTTGSDVPQSEAANTQMPAHVPLPPRDPFAVTQPDPVDPGAVGAQTQGDPVMAAALDRLRLVIQEARVAVRQFPYNVGGEIGAFVSFMREEF